MLVTKMVLLALITQGRGMCLHRSNVFFLGTSVLGYWLENWQLIKWGTCCVLMLVRTKLGGAALQHCSKENWRSALGKMLQHLACKLMEEIPWGSCGAPVVNGSEDWLRQASSMTLPSILALLWLSINGLPTSQCPSLQIVRLLIYTFETRRHRNPCNWSSILRFVRTLFFLIVFISFALCTIWNILVKPITQNSILLSKLGSIFNSWWNLEFQGSKVQRGYCLNLRWLLTEISLQNNNIGFLCCVTVVQSVFQECIL